MYYHVLQCVILDMSDAKAAGWTFTRSGDGPAQAEPGRGTLASLGGVMVRPPRHGNHNFAHLRIRLKIFIGIHRLRKRKYLRDLRMEPSIRQPVVDILLRGGEFLRIARDLHSR